MNGVFAYAILFLSCFILCVFIIIIVFVVIAAVIEYNFYIFGKIFFYNKSYDFNIMPLFHARLKLACQSSTAFIQAKATTPQ